MLLYELIYPLKYIHIINKKIVFLCSYQFRVDFFL